MQSIGDRMTRSEMIRSGYIGPNPGGVIRAIDQCERESQSCTCDWDGAPDARQAHAVRPDCPVHREEADQCA